jgi:hypothetical protein
MNEPDTINQMNLETTQETFINLTPISNGIDY